MLNVYIAPLSFKIEIVVVPKLKTSNISDAFVRHKTTLLSSGCGRKIRFSLHWKIGGSLKISHLIKFQYPI